MSRSRRPASPVVVGVVLAPVVFLALLLITDATVPGAALSSTGAGLGAYLGQRWSFRRWQAASLS